MDRPRLNHPAHPLLHGRHRRLGSTLRPNRGDMVCVDSRKVLQRQGSAWGVGLLQRRDRRGHPGPSAALHLVPEDVDAQANRRVGHLLGWPLGHSLCPRSTTLDLPDSRRPVHTRIHGQRRGSCIRGRGCHDLVHGRGQLCHPRLLHARVTTGPQGDHVGFCMAAVDEQIDYHSRSKVSIWSGLLLMVQLRKSMTLISTPSTTGTTKTHPCQSWPCSWALGQN